MVAAVSVTVDGTPAPTVRLTASGLDAAAASLTVERIWAGRTEALRDAASVLPSGGAALVRDFEVPLGRPFAYRLVTYSGAGAVLDSVLTSEVTVADVDGSHVWVMDALDPAGALLLPMIDPTDQGTSWESALTLSSPITGGLPVALLRARNQVARRFTLVVESRADGEALEAMAALGGVLTCRPASLMWHPTGIIRLAAGSMSRPMMAAWLGRASYEVSGVEVAADAWPDTVALASWDDWAAAMPLTSWGTYAAAHVGDTWIDVDAEGW